MNQRGLVLEVKEEYAVVLTPTGEFCRIPRTAQTQVGQEVSFPVLSALSRSSAMTDVKRRSRGYGYGNKRWWGFGASAAAVLLVAAGTWLGSGLAHPTTAEAYAYVSVDVNPSISLEVDKNLKVQSALGTDVDGQQLLNELKLQGLTLSAATQAIVNYAAAHNMLEQDGAILVSVSPATAGQDTTKVQSVAEQGVELAVQHSKTKLNSPPVYAVSVPPVIWHAAEKAKVSPGRLVSVLVSAEEGNPTGIAQAQGLTLAQVWSNPNAKNDLNALLSSNDKSLSETLQNLVNQGFIGLVSDETGQVNNNNAANTANVAGSLSGSAPLLPSQSDNTPVQGNHGHGEGNRGNQTDGKQSTGDGNSFGNQTAPWNALNPSHSQGNGRENSLGTLPAGTGQGSQSDSGSVTIHIGNQSFTIPWKLPDGFKTPQKEHSSGEDENPHPASQPGGVGQAHRDGRGNTKPLDGLHGNSNQTSSSNTTYGGWGSFGNTAEQQNSGGHSGDSGSHSGDSRGHSGGSSGH